MTINAAAVATIKCAKNQQRNEVVLQSYTTKSPVEGYDCSFTFSIAPDVDSKAVVRKALSCLYVLDAVEPCSLPDWVLDPETEVKTDLYQNQGNYTGEVSVHIKLIEETHTMQLMVAVPFPNHKGIWS
ncbi:hypothetical protein [Enterovibrio calviensis]|uniref:hypothetical protein n=1 Tax=Enterovibrio calviensis TaxID=91359 RepID=UPI000487C017|nr:hypothetical protein [Enterovibrio calviensis]